VSIGHARHTLHTRWFADDFLAAQIDGRKGAKDIARFVIQARIANAR
jgi:hypothetical protein